MAYTKSRLNLDLSKFKQSGPYELLSNCRLTAASKRISLCVFAEWKRMQKMCPLARTHVLLIKNIIFITTKAFLKPQSIQLCKVYNVPGVHLISRWNNFKNDL